MAVNTVDTYRFGLVVVGGKRYTSDVIISRDSVRSDWWRKEGHRLCLEDIADIIDEKPEALVVGTGAFGLVKVSPEVEKELDVRGIKLIAEATGEACQTYNRLCRSQQVIAALHLTC